MPPSLQHERYCAEIVEQTRLLRHALAGNDLTVTVPSCPDWTLGHLAVHVGGAHRWSAEIVRSRAEEDVPDAAVPLLTGPGPDGFRMLRTDSARDSAPEADPATSQRPAEAAEEELVDAAALDPAALDAWLAEGAERLADALREAGPETRVWTWAPEQRAGFWARRMTHETVIHRADACLATATAYAVAPEVAADCVDEWLDLVCSAEAQEDDPELRELRERAGDSLHLHATDADEAVRAEWLIELEPTGPRWHRTHGTATVALRGPLTEVLRVFYRRLPADSERVEVLGDAGLLDFWLARTSFGG
ncbi:maleylpyruvate isomerase N-terminal domain-containing protein [Streptomyces oceani]|uniref:Mycothiol-dependent maleylpyruvate isomerase metal-binding domain-containing protein n=1 Tax=Streptomyces oceani TaxID=1075402 RepID=A0A1E7KQ13_9ACTN|nr:maleylpyruvate isomerase family mycothiol-dependent enzyme [Streptomyces oceani]OEV06025.1 hypothetical protein AN216_00695 [Streptomyces oceani]